MRFSRIILLILDFLTSMPERACSGGGENEYCAWARACGGQRPNFQELALTFHLVEAVSLFSAVLCTEIAGLEAFRGNSFVSTFRLPGNPGVHHRLHLAFYVGFRDYTWVSWFAQLMPLPAGPSPQPGRN